MRKILCSLFVLAFVHFTVCPAWPYEIPKEDSRAKYFYIFGPYGNPDYGAEDFMQDVYINVPKDQEGDLYIYIYDPDTGDSRDLRSSPENPWDTVTEFAVYGRDNKVLAREEFGRNIVYDRGYFNFKPFSKEDGQPRGDFYQFRLVARGIEGDDANLFRVVIYPYSAEAFSFNITFRLLEPKGEKMCFYPQAPAGVTKLFVENYDIDPNGGVSELYDPASGIVYPINDSGSGRWTTTEIEIAQATQPRRLEYRLTKETQKYAHAGIKVKDDKGNLLPIYFRKGAPYSEPAVKPVEPPRPKPAPPALGKCNEFTFDATKSYDPDNQNLSFHWDFGDGATSTEPVVTHEYKKAGEYKVILTVKDDSGLECDTTTTTETVNAHLAPQPAFTAPQKACLGEEVVFDASSTPGDTLGEFTYSWDFGDRTTQEGRKVTKQYKKGGSYIVTLTVDDNKNTACSVASAQKKIYINTQPVANSGPNLVCCIGTESVFDGSGSSDPDGDRLTYEWDFGDGSTAEGVRVTHVYQKRGKYLVTLTVDDGSGMPCSSATASFEAVVNERPVAIMEVR